MYQQQMPPNAGHYQANNGMQNWFGYPHQGSRLMAHHHSAYVMPEERHMWYPGHANPAYQHPEYQEFMPAGIAPLQHQMQHQMQQHVVQQQQDNVAASSPATVSGSPDLSSPADSNGNISPQFLQVQNPRPTPARSPFDWIKKTSYQTQPTPGKTRTKDKYRVVYSDHQRMELEKEFMMFNKYITIRRKSELADALRLSERQIKIWFQNRRAKERKQAKKQEEEKARQNEMSGNAPFQQPTVQLGLENHQNIPIQAPTHTQPAVGMPRYAGTSGFKLDNNEIQQPAAPMMHRYNIENGGMELDNRVPQPGAAITRYMESGALKVDSIPQPVMMHSYLGNSNMKLESSESDN